MKKRKPGKKLSSREKVAAVLITALCILLSLAGFLLIQYINPENNGNTQINTPKTTETGVEKTVEKKTEKKAEKKEALPAVTPPVKKTEQKTVVKDKNVKPAAVIEERPPQKHKGAIIFMLDDAGNNLKELEPFLKFPGPLTIAVLPGLVHSKEAAKRIREAGKTVFLHQPMEAIGGRDPGPGAIYSGMGKNEILEVLEKNVSEIAPIYGMNNHQGSAITQDREIMETVLEFCAERNLLFIDSRTTSDTVAPVIATQMNLKIGERSVFLDNEQNKIAMNTSLQNGLDVLLKRDSVIMIGHTWSPELSAVLIDSYSKLKNEGYTFLSAKDITK